MLLKDVKSLCNELLAEMSVYSPFEMVTISEYGRVGGYDNDYQELKNDTFMFFRVMKAVHVSLDFSDIENLPEIKAKRAISEISLDKERLTLLAGLERVFAFLDIVDDKKFESSIFGNERASIILSELMVRAGIKTEQEVSTDLKNIYVSTRFRSAIDQQLVTAISQAGYNPRQPRRPLDTQPSDADWKTTKRMIEQCGGAIVSMIAKRAAGQSESPQPQMEDLAPALLEIRVAEAVFPNRVLVVADETTLQSAPTSLTTKNILKVSGPLLRASEINALTERIKHENWSISP
ncbi:MAG: hypothetical protein KTR21_15215 [Rhodobacteraceae bacterium]|nr:hypothetical protein [Paracoccaceae bacterium]